jgi:methionyl-tRNA formyltransferase
MRILLFANNWVGWQIAFWLKDHGYDIVGLVVHPAKGSKFREEIISVTDLPAECVFDGSRLQERTTLQAIRDLEPDIGVSAMFGFIMRQELLDMFLLGCVNIHPALLPYNRGAYPNVWSIIEGTPAGVTIHYIDSGIDTGAIIAQCQIVVDPTDSGGTLYHKLEHACLYLFGDTWPKIVDETATSVPQESVAGTTHKVRGVDAIDMIDLDRTYLARDLINVIRARTFDTYPGAFFWHEGRKVYLRLQLAYGDKVGETH